MRLIIFILTMSLIVTGCNDKKKSNVNILNFVENYEGYGVIRFATSLTGSIRYLEFYPLLIEKDGKVNFKDISKFNIKNGLVLRLTNKSALWQSLITNKNIELDNEGYGLAIVLLKYHINISKIKSVREYDNYLVIKKRNIKVKMFDPESNKIEIDNFKIIEEL
jgi:hypothetical protein